MPFFFFSWSGREVGRGWLRLRTQQSEGRPQGWLPEAESWVGTPGPSPWVRRVGDAGQRGHVELQGRGVVAFMEQDPLQLPTREEQGFFGGGGREGGRWGIAVMERGSGSPPK